MALEIEVAAEALERHAADAGLEVERHGRRHAALVGELEDPRRKPGVRVHRALPVETFRVGQHRLLGGEERRVLVEGGPHEQPAAALHMAADAQLQPDAVGRDLVVAEGEGRQQGQHHRLHGVGGPRHHVLGVAHDAIAERRRPGQDGPRAQPGDAVGLGQRIDEDDRLGVPRVLAVPGEQLAVARVQADVHRVEDDPGVRPAFENSVDERPHSLGRQGAAGRVVDRHEVDGVDVGAGRHLRQVIHVRVHVGGPGGQEVHLHPLQRHLVHGAREGRDRHQHRCRLRGPDPVAARLGDAEQ